MDAVYTGATPPSLKDGESRPKLEVDHDGALFVKAPVRSGAVITPGPGLIAGGPCDVVMVDVDSDVTMLLKDDVSTSTWPLRGRVLYAFQATKVTVASASAVVTVGWCRKPTA